MTKYHDQKEDASVDMCLCLAKAEKFAFRSCGLMPGSMDIGIAFPGGTHLWKS